MFGLCATTEIAQRKTSQEISGQTPKLAGFVANRQLV